MEERIKLWIRAIQPSEIDKVIEEQKGKESLKQAFLNIFLASLIPAVIAIFGMTLVFALIGALGGYGTEGGQGKTDIFGIAAFFGAIGLAIGLIYAGVMIIATPIGFLFIQAMHFAIAKLLGGKASFTRQAYFMALVFAALDAASLLNFVPCVGALVVGVLAIISIYTDYKIIKNVHSLDNARAAAATLIPLLVATVIYILFGIATAE